MKKAYIRGPGFVQGGSWDEVLLAMQHKVAGGADLSQAPEGGE